MDMKPAMQIGQPPLVLLVDDDLDNLILLSHQVSLVLNCTVLTTSNSYTALSMVTTTPPDLILLDMMLPELDGFEVARRLQQDAQTSHIPVIGVSALAHSCDRQRALEAGCRDYICKPYELEHLEAVIKRVLGLSMSPQVRLCVPMLDAS
jgi:CheY-like chemotaxis protein